MKKIRLIDIIVILLVFLVIVAIVSKVYFSSKNEKENAVNNIEITDVENVTDLTNQNTNSVLEESEYYYEERTSGPYIFNQPSDKNDTEDTIIVLWNNCRIYSIAGAQGFETVFKDYVEGVNGEDREINDEDIKKYNITYYNYLNGEFVGESNGKIESKCSNEIYVNAYNPNYAENDNVLSFSKEFNPFPRKYTELENIPNDIKNILPSGCSNIKVQEIDLDGNGTNEYIVCYSDNEKGITKFILISSEYEKISDIAYSRNNDITITFDYIEYVDLDNDNKMEILLYEPPYEGFGIEIYKYNNSVLEGNLNEFNSSGP